MMSEREGQFSAPERQAKAKKRREASQRALVAARNRKPTTDAIFDAMKRRKPVFDFARPTVTGSA